MKNINTICVRLLLRWILYQSTALVIIATTMLVSACTSNSQVAQPSQIIIPPEVTVKEREKGISLAKEAMKNRGIPLSGKMYATSVRLKPPPKSNRPGESSKSVGKQLIVTHFRYEDNSTIISTVDLANKKVIEHRTLFDHQTEISLEELQLAKQLAMEQANVRAITDKSKFPIDAFGYRIFKMPNDTDCPRLRCLIFFFYEEVGVGVRYIPQLGGVYVDLFSEKVLVEPRNADNQVNGLILDK